ncbi:MAG: PEP-CTERM sorting domain-containing protein [Candidatus Auribacterota bacterium]
MKAKKLLVIIRDLSFVVVFLASAALWADTIVYDHFNDNNLDSNWIIDYSYADGWTYSETGTNLSVTDVSSTIYNSGGGGTWGQAILQQNFNPVTDFNLGFNMSWDSQGSNSCMQFLRIYLMSDAGTIVGGAGYVDQSQVNSGMRYSQIGTVQFYAGSGDLPLSGSASINISRDTNNDVDILWNGASILSGENSEEITKILLTFGFYWGDFGYTQSFFGTGQVDLISLEGTPVPIESPIPEPTTIILIGCAIVGLVRRKK